MRSEAIVHRGDCCSPGPASDITSGSAASELVCQVSESSSCAAEYNGHGVRVVSVCELSSRKHKANGHSTVQRVVRGLTPVRISDASTGKDGGGSLIEMRRTATCEES